ncbi:zinc finger, CCHC-type containing protein [Tanacetum coccineum]
MTKDSGDSSKKEVSTTSTPQFQCPMLKPSNYSLWAIRMQIILEANGLWETIEPLKTTQPDNKKDKTAIAFLYQALPEEQLLQITKHKTAKAIWDALKTRHIGEQRVQQARLQTLKSDFEILHMKEDETIDTFTGKLTTLVNKAASLGHTIEDQTLVRKLLNVVPDRTKANEQSNLVEEDLEPTLLMAILEDLDEGKQVKEVEEQKVSLHEEDVGYKETNMDSLWYLDNGASNHMTGVREHFKELDEKVSGKVRFGDGSYIEIKGKGSILIECDDEKQRIISHVYYIPSLKSNLLSLGQFTEIGCKVVMEDDELRLYDMDNKIFMKTKLLRSMAQRDLVHGIPAIKHTTQICDVCLIGKHSRAPFPKKAKARSTSPLDLVYGDLCGPISPPTPSGKKYIFLLVDDYSRYMWVYFLSTKDQTFDTFKEYKKTIENELRTTLKMLRTDRGGEFTSNEFTQYCKENGIARQLTAPYSPQQNGVVERRNRTIMSTTRCMMKATNMPQNFWAEAVRHAIYILNSVPTKALEDITPYEAIKRRKPNLEKLRVFGCIAYAKVPSQRLTKLDDRSSRMVYLGNEQGSKAYRLFDPTTQKICVSRDVKFKENETWDWKEYMSEHINKEPEWTDFKIENLEVTRRRSPVPRCNTRAYCATHYCGDWCGSLLEEVAITGLGRLESFEFVHDPQHACSRSSSLAVTSSGLCSDVSDVGLPLEKVMTSGKNGDDGDLLLFRDGPGACDISAGTLRLFISWECSRPVAGVKVSSRSGVLNFGIGRFLVCLGNLLAIISGILMLRPKPVAGKCGRILVNRESWKFPCTRMIQMRDPYDMLFQDGE